MAELDAVGDYEADPNVMLEDVPQDIVIKALKVSCACVPVLVFACVCVCVCARARDVDMCSLEFAFAFSDFCLCVCMQQGRHIVHKFEMAGHPCLTLRARSLSLQGDPANVGKG
jgi:hypothetical protein